MEDLYERAEERSEQLQHTYELQGEWKKRGDDLLYSMIPTAVANSLRTGTDPVDTCQVIFCLIYFKIKDLSTIVHITVI